MFLPSFSRNLATKLLLAALGVLLILGLGGLPVQAQEKISARQELADTLAQDGQVRVIVQFKAPGLENLTNASRGARQDFQARGAKGLNENALHADQALAKAVAGGADAVLNRLPRGGFTVLRRMGTIPFVALSVTQDGLDALEFNSEVVHVRLDRAHPLVLPPEDGGAKGPGGDGSKTWSESPQGGWSQVGGGTTDTVGLGSPDLTTSTSIIGAPNAWSRHFTGSGWYVAILDTGLLTTHEMFAGKNIYEACFSSGDPYGVGNCPNGGSTMVGAGAAALHPSYYGGYDHGTHVAGIAAGQSSTLKGVAYGANVMAIQAYSEFYDATNGYRLLFYDSDMVAALDHVYQMSGTYNIASVNISGGGGQYFDQATCDAQNPDYKAAIDNLRSVGIPTFISSGNDGYCDATGAPGCVSSAVEVGATTNNDAEAYFNNWQIDLLDVFAPGYQIYSAIASSNTAYGIKSGTSMSCPHLTGAFALLRQYSPTGNVNSMLTTLLDRGVQIYTPCASGGSKPRVQVDKAMVSVSPTTTPDRTAMYRAYNPNLYYHFFTTRYAEFLNAVLAGYNDESTPIPFYPLVSQQAGSSGINRLYNPNQGVHYYTAKVTEANALVALGWNLERVEGYIYLSNPPAGMGLIYKLYNTATGTHLYTSSASERAYILANLPTWVDNQPLGYAYLTPTTARLAADTTTTTGSDPYVAADAAAAATAVGGGSAATASRGRAGATSGQGAAYGARASGSASGASDLGNTAVASAAGSAVRDFNGDGTSDLVWLDGAGKVNLWYMNGESVVSAAKLAPTAPAGWQLNQVGDFNGDSRPDLLWYNPADGSAALWLLNGETVTSQNALGQVADPAWAPVLAADFNGDGTDDLLWRNPATGGVAVWYLADGKLVKSMTLPETMGPAWQVR